MKVMKAMKTNKVTQASCLQVPNQHKQDACGTLKPVTGINIAEIIDGIKNHYEDMRGQSTSLKDEYSALCAITALVTVKHILERHNLAELVPAAEVDQVRGENLTQSMRLDKAGKLLDSALHFLTRYSTKYPELVAPAMDINEFLGGVGK